MQEDPFEPFRTLEGISAMLGLREPPIPTIECEDCGGRGYDPGSLDVPEPCLACAGTGREILEPMGIETLTLAEKLVASIAIAKYRKKNAA